MFVAYRPGRSVLYKDPYAEVLASKHPALGRVTCQSCAVSSLGGFRAQAARIFHTVTAAAGIRNPSQELTSRGTSGAQGLAIRMRYFRWPRSFVPNPELRSEKLRRGLLLQGSADMLVEKLGGAFERALLQQIDDG